MSLKTKANIVGDIAIVTAVIAIIIAIISLLVKGDYSGAIVYLLLVISYTCIEKYTKIRQKEIDEEVTKNTKVKRGIKNG